MLPHLTLFLQFILSYFQISKLIQTSLNYILSFLMFYTKTNMRYRMHFELLLLKMFQKITLTSFSKLWSSQWTPGGARADTIIILSLEKNNGAKLSEREKIQQRRYWKLPHGGQGVRSTWNASMNWLYWWARLLYYHIRGLERNSDMIG